MIVWSLSFCLFVCLCVCAYVCACVRSSVRKVDYYSQIAILQTIVYLLLTSSYRARYVVCCLQLKQHSVCVHS